MGMGKTTDEQSINEPAATYAVNETALNIPPQLGWLLDFDNAEQQRFLQELLNAAATAQQTGDWTSIAEQIETWKSKADFSQQKGIPGEKLLSFAGTISQQDLESMAQAIEEGCESIGNEW